MSSPASKKARITMQAVVCATGMAADGLALSSNVAVPVCGPGQVLVDVRVAGLNYIDTYIRSGLYPNPAPHILGREASGVVREVSGEGDTKGLKVGDRVAFLAAGSYAQQVCASAAKCVKLPDATSFEQGAAIPLQGMTAHYLVHSTFPLKEGHVCLIHAGAGGTGNLMIQMAKAAGATVITTVGSAAKEEIAKAAGADCVINYSEKDFHAEVMAFTKGAGVHVAYDGVGKATWEKSLECVRRRGMLVLFGNASGKVPPIDPLMLSKKGSLFVTRPTLADYTATYEEFSERISDLTNRVAMGTLKLRVDKVFPLEQAKDAHLYFESRKAMGKILLAVPTANL